MVSQKTQKDLCVTEVPRGIQFTFIVDLNYSSEISLLEGDSVWLAELFLTIIKLSVRTSQVTGFFCYKYKIVERQSLRVPSH